MVRELWIAVVGVVVGAVLGALWPQSQIRVLEAEVADLAAQPCEANEDAGRELARILHGGSPLGQPPERGTPLDSQDVRLVDPEEAPDDLDEGDPDAEVDLGSDSDAPGPSLDEDTIGMMADAMELRRRAARQALLDEAGVDDDQLGAIDDAVDVMNQELNGLATEFMQRVDEGARPSRRDLMSFSADALDVFIAAEDAFLDTLDPEQIAAAAPEATDPMQYIDPEVLRVVESLRP